MRFGGGVAHIFRVGCIQWNFDHNTLSTCNISMRSVTVLKAKKKKLLLLKFNDIQNNRKLMIDKIMSNHI